MVRACLSLSVLISNVAYTPSEPTERPPCLVAATHSIRPRGCIMSRSSGRLASRRKGNLTRFLGGRSFLAEPADDRNQTVNLLLVQGSAEGRHVVLALL